MNAPIDYCSVEADLARHLRMLDEEDELQEAADTLAAEWMESGQEYDPFNMYWLSDGLGLLSKRTEQAAASIGLELRSENYEAAGRKLAELLFEHHYIEAMEAAREHLRTQERDE